MIIRLPILLSKIYAGNNSIKLKNEIRQILYLLYRSKTISKIYIMNKMKTTFLNSKNSSTNEKDFFRLYLSGKLNLRDKHQKTFLKNF